MPLQTPVKFGENPVEEDTGQMPIKIVQTKGFCYCMSYDFGMKFVAVIMILNSILSPWISIAYTVYSTFYLIVWPEERLEEKANELEK